MINDDFMTHRPGLVSRSITAENPTGERGGGGREASSLGPGRKGRPCIGLPSQQEIALAEIAGTGCIRHIWITVPRQTETSAYVLRDIVLRAYWDGDETPAIEVPLGDFFCCGFGQPADVGSVPITVGPVGGMNSYWPMPFGAGAKITVENQGDSEVGGFFFQIDYSLGDEVADSGRLHAQWRRSNGTTQLGEDHLILDGVRGAGSYVGSYLAIAQLSRFWYGEGEIKFYLDGDEWPTICGTGTEDYFGGAWAFQPHFDRSRRPMPIAYTAPYSGYLGVVTDDRSDWSDFAPLGVPSHGMYRWHLPDPIRFDESLRVTMQQIGHDSHELFERSDDIATVAYWYQFTGRTERVALPLARQRWPR
jgi:hypothetical protein